MQRTLGAVVVWALASSGAWAVDTRADEWPPPTGPACKPTRSELAEAKSLLSLVRRAGVADAVYYLRAAYKRDCTNHAILKWLGRTLADGGQHAAAAAAYSLYLARARVELTERLEVERKIEQLVDVPVPSSARASIGTPLPDEPWSRTTAPSASATSATASAYAWVTAASSVPDRPWVPRVHGSTSTSVRPASSTPPMKR